MGEKERVQEGVAVSGFSLLEVILALGVFAVAATVLMRGMAHSLSGFQEAEQRLQAVGMMASMDAVLSDQLRSVEPGKDGQQAWNGGGDGTWVFVASRDGSRIGSSGAPDGIAPAQQFYRIEVRPADERVIPAGTGPEAVRVMELTVNWPYRIPASNPSGYREVRAESQHQLRYWSAVRP